MKFYKSRIRMLFPFYPDDYQLYTCQGLGVTGCGDTPVEAYEHWFATLQEDYTIKFYFVRFNIWMTKFYKTLEL